MQVHQEILPKGWSVVYKEGCPLCKISNTDSVFMLTIWNDFTWDISVGTEQIKTTQRSQMLADLSPIFNNVDFIVDVLKVLDNSQVCIGNADEKFHDICHSHSGVFKDYQAINYCKKYTNNDDFYFRFSHCAAYLVLCLL